MHERLTWNPADPAPYESAWSVFVKIMALNFCTPLDIAQSIARNNVSAPKRLEFRDSSWIDFARYGDLLGVAPDRLKRGFLDQLGFPRVRGDSTFRGIRFCPECLKLGYHSVLFDLALVSECPLHACKLSEGCLSCYWTVVTKGLIRTTRPYLIPGGVIHDDHWRSDIYSSSCDHITFDPDLVMLANVMDRDAAETIRKISDEFVRWWHRAFASGDDWSICIAELAQLEFSKDSIKCLGWELDFARTMIGSCPWPTSIPPLPVDFAHITSKKIDLAEVENKVPLNSELGAIYKAIRRQLFIKYVKPSHLTCWNELSSYDRESSLAISGSRVCSLVLAFMAWRMSIEGFSNIEGFRIRRPINDYVWSFVSPKSGLLKVATFWYVQFFAVLDELQAKLRDGGHFYIERRDYGVCFHGAAFNTSVNEQASIGFDTWWLLFPNKADLVRKAWARCVAKRKGNSTMVSLSARNALTGWAWSGQYSENNVPRLLFRIKDDSSMRKGSRSYIYVTF